MLTGSCLKFVLFTNSSPLCVSDRGSRKGGQANSSRRGGGAVSLQTGHPSGEGDQRGEGKDTLKSPVPTSGGMSLSLYSPPSA